MQAAKRSIVGQRNSQVDLSAGKIIPADRSKQVVGADKSYKFALMDICLFSCTFFVVVCYLSQQQQQVCVELYQSLVEFRGVEIVGRSQSSTTTMLPEA